MNAREGGIDTDDTQITFGDMQYESIVSKNVLNIKSMHRQYIDLNNIIEKEKHH